MVPQSSQSGHLYGTSSSRKPGKSKRNRLRIRNNYVFQKPMMMGSCVFFLTCENRKARLERINKAWAVRSCCKYWLNCLHCRAHLMDRLGPFIPNLYVVLWWTLWKSTPASTYWESAWSEDEDEVCGFRRCVQRTRTLHTRVSYEHVHVVLGIDIALYVT